MGIAVSINIPFITGRADYYGRNLYANTAPAVKHAYCDALLAEAQSIGDDIRDAGEEVSVLAFENGAIGTIEPAKLRPFLRELAAALPLADDCFVSAEADPGLLSTATVEELRVLGVDALRFHYLTSDAVESEWLQRACAVNEMSKTRTVLEGTGVRDFDMQLLLGFRGQSEKTLVKTLRDAALMDEVNHCTLLVAAGEQFAGDELAVQMYGVAQAFLEEHGFVRYAPTCFAKPGHELAIEAGCKGDGIVSLGPSTTSRFAGLMWANAGDIQRYIESEADPEAITEVALEVGDAQAKALDAVEAAWRAQVVPQDALAAVLAQDASALDGLVAADGALTALGCLRFDAVAQKLTAALL